MKKLFRRLRLALLCAGFVFLAVYLFRYTPWQRWKKPDFSPVAQPGVPIVEAVYKFRNERGLWPLYLKDLAPEFLPKPPDERAWFYDTMRPYPQLKRETPTEGVWVGYDFDPGNTGWKAWGTFLDVHALAVTQPAPALATMPERALLERQLKELTRRVSDEPLIMEHWVSKAVVLRRLGEGKAFAALLEEMIRRRPDFYWPMLARAVDEAEQAERLEQDPSVAAGDPLSVLRASATDTASAPASASAPAEAPAEAPSTQPEGPKTAGQAFVAWVRARPSFLNYFYLHVYARKLGKTDAAEAAILEALKYPLEADDTYRVDYYLWRMARYLYERGNYEGVVTVCNRWQQRAEAPGGEGDKSYFAWRAAANLARGNIDAAQGDAERASIANDMARMWARNLDKLGRATVEKNRAFKYDAGPRAEYDVWAMQSH